MGIDTSFGIKLIETLPLVEGKSSAVMLGRQTMNVGPRGRRFIRQALRAAKLSPDFGNYLQEDGFSETFLRKLGYPPTASMDYSDFEDCDYTHDLNEPLPAELRQKFDVVIDGGTIEHVFNTPQALDNVFHMLKDDGIFISVNGMTGWAGHGFYQFSPELVWRYWQDARNCEVRTCQAVSVDPSEQAIPVTDTGKSGARFRGLGLHGRWYLYYVVKKPSNANGVKQLNNIQQGDYAVKWENAPKEQSAGLYYMSLTELADKYGSDKGSTGHRYTELYHMLFQPFIDRPITFMEMGLLIGGPEHGISADRETKDLPSIRMWLEYFKKAQIIGLDISDFSWFTHDRFSFVRCDMDTRPNIVAATSALPELDIIIDDASHASHHQQNAFLTLFPKLRSGGLYIIEDLSWQPKPYEQSGITKTAALFQSYQQDRAFTHSDPNVAAEFNALRDDMSGCFIFPVRYQKQRRDQVLVVHKR